MGVGRFMVGRFPRAARSVDVADVEADGIERDNGLVLGSGERYGRAGEAPGLSGIPCAGGLLNICSHRPDEALAEDDGELGLGHGPLTWRHIPLFFRSVQDQIEQLGGSIVAGEMSPGPDGPPEFRVQRLY